MVDRGGHFSEESGSARGYGLQNSQLIECCLEYLKPIWLTYLAKLALVGLAQSTWLGVLG